MPSEQNPTCPRCGYQYESWVEVCPDCGAILETRPPAEPASAKLDPHEDPRWTIVTNVPNAILGQFIKSQLEDAGIPVIMLRSRSADIAEFSHNDFVPQDLRVPFDRVREARRIIDSAPGDDYGAHFSPGGFDDVETDEEASVAPSSGLPEGWTMLPTERDLDARQQVRRTHGEVLKGWYWSDESDEEDDDRYDDEPVEFAAPATYGEPDKYQMRYAYGPTRWVRVIYGLLLLALSLPFLIQLVSQVWQMFTRFP